MLCTEKFSLPLVVVKQLWLQVDIANDNLRLGYLSSRSADGEFYEKDSDCRKCLRLLSHATPSEFSKVYDEKPRIRIQELGLWRNDGS
jgi:hypothetical protein